MIVGILVLIQYIWQWARHRGGILELAAVLVCSGGYLYLVRSNALGIATVVAVMGFVWLFLSWFSQRWTLLRALTTLAGLMVVLQASLGGLRVLKMSDPYGIVHGCLGQLFFCLLVLIAHVASPTWRHGRLILTGGDRTWALLSSTLLFLAVSAQLVIGAILRHTQRASLAATDLLTTGGMIVPPTDQPQLFTLFLHKYWGFILALLIVLVARSARTWTGDAPVLRIIPRLLLVMPFLQAGLGIAVVLTNKPFWVTNLHVLNGLGLLALSFLLMVTAWGSSRTLGVVADDADDEAASSGNPPALA